MLLSFLQHYWTALLLNACPTTYSKLPYRKTIARNHLSSSFCQQALPVFSSRANTSFLYLSSCANTIQTSLVKFHWLWETVEEIINKKKNIQWHFEGIHSFSKQYLVQDFLLCFLSYPSTSQIDWGILFHWHNYTKTWHPLACFWHIDVWSTFEFHHMLIHALRTIIWNRIT